MRANPAGEMPGEPRELEGGRNWKIVLVRALGVLLALGIAALLAVAVTGYTLPRNYLVRTSMILNQPREAVWDVIMNFEDTPEWFSGWRSAVQVDGEDGGQDTWELTDEYGIAMRIAEVESDPPERSLWSIYSLDEPGMGGTLEYRLDALADDKTQLTLIEQYHTDNPFKRFMTHYVLGPDYFQKAYCQALAEHFGEPYNPTQPPPL